MVWELDEKIELEAKRYVDSLSEGLTYNKKEMESAFRMGFARGMTVGAKFMAEK